VIPDSPFTLVLSGGGLKGLAHIGVLRALEERDLVPSLVVGSSIGSLIAAAWAAGVPTPAIDAVIRTASVMAGNDFAADARTLDRMGFVGMDRAQIRHILDHGFQ